MLSKLKILKPKNFWSKKAKQNMKGSGLLVQTSNRAKENKFGQMDQFTKDGGRMTKPMEKED